MDILDVTLREGQQRAGASFSIDQKAEVTRDLSELGVDFVQIGFPAADDGTDLVCDRVDVEANLTGIARIVEKDIEAAVDAGIDVIELFAPTSEQQLTHVLHADEATLIDRLEAAVERATDSGREVHFTAMDGFRSDPSFIGSLLERFAGAVAYFSIADTVGAMTPGGVRDFIEALPGSVDRSTLGVHFHDDLGVATANAMVAADCGVGKIDVSVAGIGERAGNTALEEVVVAATVADRAIDLAVDQRSLVPTARRILATLDESVGPGKPVLGERAFEHESGLHTAAMLDEPSLFEPVDPATFGGSRRLLFGPTTGRGAAERLLERAGRAATADRIDALLDELERDGPMSLDAALAAIERRFDPDDA